MSNIFEVVYVLMVCGKSLDPRESLIIAYDVTERLDAAPSHELPGTDQSFSCERYSITCGILVYKGRGRRVVGLVFYSI